jgi:hypothetical protein
VLPSISWWLLYRSFKHVLSVSSVPLTERSPFVPIFPVIQVMQFKYLLFTKSHYSIFIVHTLWHYFLLSSHFSLSLSLSLLIHFSQLFPHSVIIYFCYNIPKFRRHIPSCFSKIKLKSIEFELLYISKVLRRFVSYYKLHVSQEMINLHYWHTELPSNVWNFVVSTTTSLPDLSQYVRELAPYTKGIKVLFRSWP